MTPRTLAWRLALGLTSGALLALIALPIIALFARVPTIDLLMRLRQPAVGQALRLSVLTSAAAVLIVIGLGVPTAYLLATCRFRGKRLMELVLDLPMVLPPTVAGFALLLAFGRMGLAGGALGLFGLTLPYTTLGVVMAQAFMAAPFLINPVRAAFASVDPRLLDAASTLRASEAYVAWRVRLPLILPALVAGVAMSWARALGEFGATITFAGNLPGVTQTMPLAVYVELQHDLETAIALSVILLLISAGLLFGLRRTAAAWGSDARR